MSGDVQPRKRKDKRRKKEDAPVTEEVHSNFSSDETIHIFKESSTGGNVCAKIVFFLLLGGLAVMVGLILTEYRGSCDVDTPIAESRFAQVLDGWVDESQPKHDEHEEPLEESEEHEHDEDGGHMEEHDEHEDEEEHEEEVHEKEDDEPAAVSEEEEEEETAASEEEEETAAASEEEEEEETAAASEEEEEEEPTAASEEEEEEDEDEGEQAAASEEEEEEASEERTIEESEEATKEDDDDNDEDDDEVEQKEEEKEEDDDDDNDDDDDDDDDDNDDDDQDKDASQEEFGEIPGVTESAEEQDSQADDGDEDDAEDDGSDDTASPEEGDGDTEKEVKGEQPGGEDDDEPEPSGIALKFGVGVALVLVAHVVLVRKWNTDATQQGDSRVEEHSPETASRDEEMEESEYSEEEQEGSREQPFRVETYEDLLGKFRSNIDKKEAPVVKHQEEEEEEEVEEEEEEEEEEEDDEEEVLPKTKEVAQKEESEEEIESEEEEEDEDEEEEEVELPKLQRASARKLIEDTDPEDEDEDEEEEEQQSVPIRKAPAGSGEQSAGYANEDISNEDDFKIHSQLDIADDEENPEAALQLFEAILSLHPQSPRANYGKARSLDRLAEMKHSNVFLEKCIAAYSQVLALGARVPDKLFLLAANRCIDRMRFRGQHLAAIPVHKKLIERFPNDPAHANQLAVTYLMVNRVEDARQVLKDTLKSWPNNGFAQVHYGFILKTTDNNNEEAVDYLTRGIASREEGTIDGRFFFQLGDALARLGRQGEAIKVYEVGVREGLFLSKYQRSLYNVNHLRAQPWWTPEETTYAEHFKKLVANWKVIREEGLAALSGEVFLDEAENLRDIGDWKQFELFARGRRIAVNCGKAPVTCRLISEFPSARDCRRGQAKFSVMHPGTHVWPHCGPTNCRLRSHLGLVVPKNTYIRVAEETRSWEEGKLFIFDDSFEHEVWHNGTGLRLVLIVDVWHPNLTEQERRSLPAI